MRIPYRKPGKYNYDTADPLMTPAKLAELIAKLEKLKNISRPFAMSEVSRLAELGDFSENAEYQLAKGRLRGINNSILKLEHQINNVDIIKVERNNDLIQVGSKVTLECGGKKRTYQILGSTETNPAKGIISYQSALGAALLGHSVGDKIVVKLAGREVEYSIINNSIT